MRILKAGLIAGLAGGALDIIAAMTIYPAMYPGATWMRVLQSVAAGVLGREAARAGGMGAALLGLALHMVIAICAGLVLAYAMKHEAALRRLAPLTGAGFGVAMYYFMQKIVLPLSATGGGGAPDAKGLAVGLAIHIFIFGIPMALIARQFLSEKD